jgi:hypothetical protein
MTYASLRFTNYCKQIQSRHKQKNGRLGYNVEQKLTGTPM